MAKTYYITTPIYYVNDKPHLGHTYTTVLADALARYHRLGGADVCLLTGTDEHGLKMQRTAQELGVTVQQLVDKNSAEWRKTWETLGIRFDEFLRTTESRHRQALDEISRRVRDNGYFYKGSYSGWYCVKCEMYVGEGEERPNCPVCGRPTEHVTEESYFFKLSSFQEKLLKLYRERPEFVVPQSRLNEIVSFVSGGLKDISFTRTSFKWGIPAEFDPGHVVYVWFDALTSYISGIGFGNDEARFRKYWPARVHIIGKDIVRFHAVYWPAFLMAAGLDVPHQILSHGWLLTQDEKMSKSRGNFVDPLLFQKHFPVDALKYFLLREVPVGADMNFTFDGLLQRINSDLANDLGNLVSRSLKMVENYCDGKVPSGGVIEPDLEERFNRTLESFHRSFENYNLNRALEAVWKFISAANRYIVANEPWKLSKDPARKSDLERVMLNSVEVLRLLALLLRPILPETAAEIWKSLGISSSLEGVTWEQVRWGEFPQGASIGAIKQIFPRIDKDLFMEKILPAQHSGEHVEDDNRITIEEFAKVDLRVGQIVHAERVHKSDKLVKLEVDIGSEKRQVVAGIGRKYTPEDLLGKKIILVANLKSAKLMGIESNGMVLAATEQDIPILATFVEQVSPGSKLK